MENNADFENALSGQELAGKIDEAILEVKDAVEIAVRETLGDTVKEAIEDVLEDAVQEAVQEALEDSVEDAIEDALQQTPIPSSASKLYILSQDRKHLGEFIFAYIWNEKNINITTTTKPGSNTLCFGSYATEEEAVAELGRIADALAALRPGKVIVHKMK